MITKQEIRQQIEHQDGAVSEKWTALLRHCNEEELCNRKNGTGHITASGIIVDLYHRKALLLHHKTLNKWLSPGGHVQDTDTSILSAALREIQEETGIAPEQLVPMNVINGVQYCLEINTHPIPLNKKKKEGAHFHHDFQYVFRYTGEEKITIDHRESLDYNWIPVNDPSLKNAFNQPELEKIIYQTLLDEFEGPVTVSPVFNEKRKMLVLDKLARLYKETRRDDLAEKAYTRLLKITGKLAKGNDDVFLRRLATYQYELGKVTGRRNLEERMYLQAIKTYYKTENLTKVLEISTHLSLLYQKTGRDEMTGELCRKISAHFKNTARNTWDSLKKRLCILTHFYHLYQSAGNFSACQQILLKKTDTYEQLCEEAGTLYGPALAASYTALAKSTQDESLKEKMYLKAAGIYKQLLPFGNYWSEITGIHEILVELYIRSGRNDLAEQLIPEVLDGYQQMTRDKQNEFLKAIKKQSDPGPSATY